MNPDFDGRKSTRKPSGNTTAAARTVNTPREAKPAPGSSMDILDPVETMISGYAAAQQIEDQVKNAATPAPAPMRFSDGVANSTLIESKGVFALVWDWLQRNPFPMRDTLGPLPSLAFWAVALAVGVWAARRYRK